MTLINPKKRALKKKNNACRILAINITGLTPFKTFKLPVEYFLLPCNKSKR